MTFQIPAEAHSDDLIIEIDFDAIDYIKQADLATLRDLRECDWGGDYPADRVALHYEEGATKPLFDYLEATKHSRTKRGECGFECYVDAEAVEAWLATHRPDIYAELCAEEEGVMEAQDIYGKIIELSDQSLEGGGHFDEVCGNLEIALYAAILLIPPGCLDEYWAEVRQDIRDRLGLDDLEDAAAE